MNQLEALGSRGGLPNFYQPGDTFVYLSPLDMHKYSWEVHGSESEPSVGTGYERIADNTGWVVRVCVDAWDVQESTPSWDRHAWLRLAYTHTSTVHRSTNKSIRISTDK